MADIKTFQVLELGIRNRQAIVGQYDYRNAILFSLCRAIPALSNSICVCYNFASL